MAGLLVVLAAIAALGYQSLAASSARVASPSSRGGHRYMPHGVRLSSAWPEYRQAAVILTGQQRIHAGPNQHPAPIASVAKVMTAYLVLREHPLRPGEDGPTITLTAADVADTDRRAGQHESVVPVATGEQLTELQALQALLLPSANNIAAVLADWDAGSTDLFVARMNAAARRLGMTHTRYTDPSGYDDATVSTAATAGAAGSGTAHEKAVDTSSGAFTQTFEPRERTRSRRGSRADGPEAFMPPRWALSRPVPGRAST